jgi:hypothetical protein
VATMMDGASASGAEAEPTAQQSHQRMFGDSKRHSAVKNAPINQIQLHVFLARGDTCKQIATLKPPVVGSQPAGPQANKLGPDTAKLSRQRHLHGRPQRIIPKPSPSQGEPLHQCILVSDESYHKGTVSPHQQS